MCFAIPKKIDEVIGKIAITADKKTIKLGGLKVKKGEYVHVIGPVAIEKLTNQDASAILNTIKTLNNRS